MKASDWTGARGTRERRLWSKYEDREGKEQGRKTKRWQPSIQTHTWMSEGKSLQKHANKNLNKGVRSANQLELKKKFKCTFGKTWMNKTAIVKLSPF